MLTSSASWQGLTPISHRTSRTFARLESFLDLKTREKYTLCSRTGVNLSSREEPNSGARPHPTASFRCRWIGAPNDIGYKHTHRRLLNLPTVRDSSRTFELISIRVSSTRLPSLQSMQNGFGVQFSSSLVTPGTRKPGNIGTSIRRHHLPLCEINKEIL